MFQRFFLFISLLCVPAVAAAQPAYTDYYWGGYLGGVASADAEGESANFFDPSKSIDLRPGSDFTLGAVVGATIASNVRAELELSYQSTDSDGVNFGSSVKQDASGGLSSASLHLNFWYDFPIMGSFRPYAGAGLGIATVDNDVKTSAGVTRCLIPGFDGAIFSQAWKDILWDRYVTGAPRPRTQSELQYSDRKLRPQS